MEKNKKDYGYITVPSLIVAVLWLLIWSYNKGMFLN